MRKILFIGFVCFCTNLSVFADETCDEALVEAKQKYNAGNYAKAKALFEFIKDECGSNYRDVNSWISKCNSALNPTLSLSRSSISFGSSSSSSSITVTSNCDWRIRTAGSSWLSTSISGNTINVSCSSNTSSSSRSSYFDVITTDGARSARVSVSQSGVTPPSLSVSRTALSVGSSATTEYLTVTCNSSWEIQFPSGSMYSVTRSGNTLTVKINANTSTESRSDFFNIKTTDDSKSVRVTINQSGKSISSSSNNAFASIEKVWVDHNVYQNSLKGMRIHVKFTVYNMLNRTGQATVYFYYSNGNALKDINGSYKTTNGNVATHVDFTPNYTSCIFKDLQIFMPYNELHCTNRGRYDLKFFVSIWSDYNVEMKKSDWVNFTLTN